MGAIIKLTAAVILFTVLKPVFVSGGNTFSSPVSEKLEKFSASARPQKIFLHLDKNGYYAGETIWFKAYLFDGTDHHPATDTSNVFIELIDSQGKLVDIKILLATEGTAKGDMELNNEIPDGNYLIRAYTGWMRNFGEDYYFTQYLNIKNGEYKNMIPRLDILKNKLFNWRLDRMKRKHTVVFSPEGGNLLKGITNRVALTIEDLLGNGQKAEAKIFDEEGTVITTFNTEYNGIGVFEITPEPGKSYKASVSVDGAKYMDYDLPDILTEGYSLKINKEDGIIKAKIISTVKQDNPLYSEKLILIAHSRGVPYFESSFIAGDKIETSINRTLFPSGIVHFTVLTGNYVPVAERLIFISRKDNISFAPSLDLIEIEGRDYIDIQFKVIDDAGDPVAGSFSFSAVTGPDFPGSESKDISSYILLNSDIKSSATKPLSYLQTDNGNDVSPDQLLLTYSWQRFHWKEVIEGKSREIEFFPSTGLTLEGTLMNPARNESLSNYPVSLMVKSGHDDLYETHTGKRGAFSFSGLFYEGMVDVELSSKRLPVGHPPVVNLDLKSSKDYNYAYSVYTVKHRVTTRGKDWKRRRRISSSPINSSHEPNVNPPLYGSPDQTIYIDYEHSTERNIYQVLRSRATGLSFESGRIAIRSQASQVLGNEPRYMLDGMFVDGNLFLSMYPKDIERIEIFKGSSASIFGSRGGAGVILAYSRKAGYSGFEDLIPITIMGYHTPGEFNSGYSINDASWQEGERLKTLHWDPDLISSKDGLISVRFPLIPGMDDFTFTIQGADRQGGFGFAEILVDIED